MYKGEDFTNKIVGTYLVLGKLRVHKYPSGNTHHIWLVECTNCGNKVETQSQKVFASKIGCKKCYGQAMSGSNSCHWKGGRTVPGYFLSKVIFGSKRSRDIEVSITIEYLDELWERQEGKCVYTGWDLSFGKSGVLGTASLDRIDSSIGYVEENVQFVHKDVNTMKWELSNARFLEICSAIHNYRRD